MNLKQGSNNAEWVKTRDTAHDISCGTADFKSGADYGEKKIKETGIEVEEVVGDAVETHIDAEKSNATKAWDVTKDIAHDVSNSAYNMGKDMAENVSHSAYNMGSDICGAVKHGAEAGWHGAEASWNKTTDK